jgi:hypothetical protein
LSRGPVAPDPLAVTPPIGYPASAEKDMTGSVVRSLPFLFSSMILSECRTPLFGIMLGGGLFTA